MKSGTFFLSLILLPGCTQNVHLKSSVRIPRVVIDGREVRNLSPSGQETSLPIRFGPASFSIFDDEQLLKTGEVPRSKVSPWVFGISVGSSMVLSPALAVTGALLVNPSWVYASSVFLNGGGVGAFWAYLAQTSSFWTLPAMLCGAIIGILPLFGLTFSERFPDVVLISGPDLMRR